MNDNSLDHIRKETLNSIAQTELMFKALLGACGVAELIGLVAVIWLMDWSDPTHRLIFAATMLIWINLALWVYTLAVRNRVGEQRILQAIEIIHDTSQQEEKL